MPHRDREFSQLNRSIALVRYIVRDMILFGAGVWAFIAQVQDDRDRPILLAATLALLGLPVVMHRDEVHRDETQEGGDDDGSSESP